MQPITRSYSPPVSNEIANRDSTLHHSTAASTRESTSSVLRDDNTISSMSASSVQTEDTLGSVSLDIDTSLGMTDEARFGNSYVQPEARTNQLNNEPESQHPSEETFMISDHESLTDSDTQKRSWMYKLKKAARSWWLWEIGGAALSIGCIVAILIIIPHIHNQPLKNWRFMIAPNTMVSTLITVSKTSMLLAVAAGMGQLKWQHFHRDTRPISDLDAYDEASRGPWGALTFMFLSPSRWKDTIAIIGSFVMLSSLTMEPLAQQLLSFQTRHVSQDNGNAWISMTTSYEEQRMPFGDELELRAQSVILQGILGVLPPLSYTCSSNNCSWSDFRTLGVCSSCWDVTSDCSVEDVPPPYRIAPHRAYYTTPKGITLPLSYSKVPAGEIVMSGNTTREGITNLTDIFFVAIANASFRPSTWNPTFGFYGYRQPDITECKVNWCAKFYSNLRMTNGDLNYTVEEESFSSEETYGTDSIDSIGAFDECRHLTYGNAIFRVARGGTSYKFVLACRDISIISQYLTDLLKFQVSAVDASLASAQLIINTESASAAMNAIANAFSVYLMTSTSNTTRHYGEAFSPEVFVMISWQWLVFPGFLTILGACFLGTCLWTSRTQRTSFLWKDSLVPLLFHGLSGWDKNELHANDKIEMDERAKRMMAKLEMDDGGSLKFVKA